jgi:Mg-chelatase subunit ChlI
MLPTQLRTGLVGETETSELEQNAVETTIALLRMFSREALLVAGRVVAARGERVVKEGDMRDALMYCARTFLQQTDERVLAARVQEEVQNMRDESDEEDGEESDEDSDEDSDEEAGEETESGEEGGGEEGGDDAAPPSPKDVALARHVRAVVATWSQWHPTDPVHAMLKRAIDQTAYRGDAANHTPGA